MDTNVRTTAISNHLTEGTKRAMVTGKPDTEIRVMEPDMDKLDTEIGVMEADTDKSDMEIMVIILLFFFSAICSF